MSIYPKKVTKNENVIIHLRFENPDNKFEIIKYRLLISNPNEDIIYSKQDTFILGSDIDKYVKQLYHSIFITDEFMPGKYKVIFYLTCRGVKVQSVTKDNDFFLVENISIVHKNDNIELINNSKEKVECYLYKNSDNQKTKIILNELEKIIIDNSYKFIEYGNNKIIPICPKNKMCYIKNPDIRIKNDELINIDDEKKITINKKDLKRFKNMINFNVKSKVDKKLCDLDLIYDLNNDR